MACLEGLHRQAPSIVREWAERISCEDTSAYGFTSTFQQNIASLALAKELRGLVAPGVKILFGGGNCEGPMGQALADAFPFVSCVVSGEAEQVIGDLLASTTHERFIPGTAVADMDSLAEPEFTDYFAQLEGLASTFRPNLVAESSRGCWWGAKSHCTFCGLNGSTMAFRSKSPARLVEQLFSAQRRYGISEFTMADNIIDLRTSTQCCHCWRAPTSKSACFTKRNRISEAAAGDDGCGGHLLDTTGDRKPEHQHPATDGERRQRSSEHSAVEVGQGVSYSCGVEPAVWVSWRTRARILHDGGSRTVTASSARTDWTRSDHTRSVQSLSSGTGETRHDIRSGR